MDIQQEVQEARAFLEQCKGKYDLIFELQQNLDREREDLKLRLDLKKKRLPRLAALEMMGEAQNGDVAAVKSEIVEIESALAMIPIAYKGLQEIQSEFVTKHARAANILRRHELETEWQQMKDQLEQKFDKHLAGRFRQFSHELGRADEVRDFIAELEDKWRKLPICEH